MPNLKEQLKGKLSSQELLVLRKAFDVVGDIAILEIPVQLKKKQKLIAATVLDLQKNIKAVYKEAEGRKGKFRLQKLVWLAGEKRTETLCNENGVRLKVDVSKAYFSPRTSSERMRIVRQVGRGEKVLVMFSGIGPYVVEIAKHTAASLVVGVESNKAAHRYALENIRLNKVQEKAQALVGDVRKVLPTLPERFDRVIMPLPKGAYQYLDVALSKVKRGGIIHYYDFLPQEDIPTIAKERLAEAAAKAGRKPKILSVVRCGQLAVRHYKVCVDAKIF